MKYEIGKGVVRKEGEEFVYNGSMPFENGEEEYSK